MGKADKLRICPTTRIPTTAGAGTWNQTWYWGGQSGNTNHHGRYALNGWLYAGGWEPFLGLAANPARAFRSQGAIVQPARTPAFRDANWPDAWFEASNRPVPNFATGMASGAGGSGRILLARHGNLPTPPPSAVNTAGALPGATTMGFMDGHVETVRLENLWRLYWYQDHGAPPARPRQPHV